MFRFRRPRSRTNKLITGITISACRQWLRLTALMLLAVLSLVSAPVRADAALSINPTLVVLEVNQPSAEITLANHGDRTGTFEMSWSDDMTMTSEGGLIKYDGQAPWSVQPYMRYSPRRVTLAPMESRTIKFTLRHGQDVPEGEYYSHFKVLMLNTEDPSAEQADADNRSSGIAIKTRAAVAIPIVWRNSQNTSTASIESVRIDRDANQLTVDVRRYGQLSVRGYLHVFETARDGTRRSLAEPVPLVIYPNINTLLKAIALDDGVMAGSLPRGTEVYYSPDLEITDRSIVFASYSIVP